MDYTIYERAPGEYIISVLCGTTVMFQINIPLSKKDYETGLKNKGHFVEIARTISDDPHHWFSKNIRNPSDSEH